MSVSFIPVTRENVRIAAEIHAVSWRESHRAFCSREFVSAHTAQRQTAYLLSELEGGKRIWMLDVDGEAVALVSVCGALIENLYVLPERQNNGYGSRLLRFAMGQCDGVPTLWILENNDGARRLYERNGFAATGNQNHLSDTLSEIEMRYENRPGT